MIMPSVIILLPFVALVLGYCWMAWEPRAKTLGEKANNFVIYVIGGFIVCCYVIAFIVEFIQLNQ